MSYSRFLKVGLIQTTVNDTLNWSQFPFRITDDYQLDVWRQLKKGFVNFKNHTTQPQIVIIPELSIPLGYIQDLRNLARKMGVLVIAGLDFINHIEERKVENKGIVIVPDKWPDSGPSFRDHYFLFGKTFFSHIEKTEFRKPENSGVTGLPDPSMYILDAGPLGTIGLAICSDFFDIERFVLYKGRIQHMVVIAYNRDVNSYYFLSEAIARLVFCNVIICNTGNYGGTMVFSPYKKDYKRYLYKHEGADLFTSQIVELPVSDLVKAQMSDDDISEDFKAKPPGYDFIGWPV
jgi:hypothetical protein